MAERELTIRLRADGRGLTATVNQGTRQFQLFGRQLDQTAAKTAALAKNTGTLTGGLGALRTLLPALGFALLIRHATQAAEQFKSIEGRVRLATEAMGDYNHVSRELFAISQRSGVALANTANLFININRAAEDIGRSRADVLQLTDTIQQLGVISGASGEAMRNSLRQFSQAMAGGVVRAEEFNSIIENTPEIAVRIARGMGMSVGQLRLAVVEGRVLSDQVFASLLSQTDQIQRDFENMPLTIGRAWTMLTNSMGRYVAMANESSGLTSTLATAIQRASRALDEMVDSGDTRALELLGSALAVIAENIDLIAVAVGGILAKNLLGLLAARLTAVAAAGTAARGAFLLLGGPTGIAVTAAVGIYALVDAIRSHKDASETAAEAQREYENAIRAGGDAAIEAAQKAVRAKIAELTQIQEAQRFLRDTYGKDQETPGLDARFAEAVDELKKLEAGLGAAKQGITEFGIASDESFGKFSRAVDESQLKAAEAKATLDGFLKSMREEAEVANLSARELASYKAVQEAMKAGVTEGIDQVHTLALALYDEARAREEAKRKTEEQRAAMEAAAKARMEELNAMAEAEAIAWDFDRVEQFEREQTIARRQGLQERVNDLVGSLETETEAINREYQARLATLDQAQREGLTIIGGYAQARERIERQYSERITEMYRQEWEEKHRILTGFIDNASQGIARYVTDTIRGEKEAKDAARSQLDERLRDLQERLEDGTIATDEANKERKQLYEDFYDRINEIEKEAADRLKDTLVNAFVSAIEEMLAEWIKRGMTRLAIGFTEGKGGILGALGDVISGGQRTGGGGDGTGIVQSAIQKGVVEGVKNSALGKAVTTWWTKNVTGSYYAAGNLGFKGPGVMNYGTASSASGLGSSATAAGNLGFKGPGVTNFGGGASAASGGIPAWGGAAVMALVALGAGMMEKSMQRSIQRAREEMMANFSPADSERIGLDSTFIGSLETGRDGVERMYAAVDKKLVVALEEVNAITGAIGLRMAMNGEHVHQLTGNVDQVRAALEGAQITGFAFAGSLETAIEKGNGLRVNIEGNSEIIKQALTSAAQQGDLAFRQFTETASGASAVLTGDIGKWQSVLQDFVTTAVAAAIAGVDSLASGANNAAGAFERMAAAARSVPSVGGSNPFGGRDGADGSHAGGHPFIPFDGYRAILHKGERVLTAADNRRLMQAPVAAPTDFGPVVAEIRRTNERLARIEAEQARVAESASRANRLELMRARR